MEHGDNINFSTLYTRNCIRVDLDEVKRLKAKMYPSIGISKTDDIELLEALRIYKMHLQRKIKRGEF
jgi:hypothetical protein